MGSSRRVLLRSIAGTTTLTLLAGCSSNSDATATTDHERDPTATTDGTEELTTSTQSDTDDPNVLNSVPERTDHVVDAESVAFAPAELTVETGDTVAFKHVEGGAHSVTARADGIPDDADYWASGGFDSESAAEAGFQSYDGAVTEGTVYVHTFETTGTHEYYCIPHSHVQMDGTIRVQSK